jgi:hypothetical protein
VKSPQKPDNYVYEAKFVDHFSSLNDNEEVLSIEHDQPPFQPQNSVSVHQLELNTLIG